MTFLEQFEQLRQKTPHIGLQCVQNENSPFCQYTEKSKNCYMTFASYQDEDCMYNHRIFYCRDCNDCALCHKCELCYECIDCIQCYNCSYCDHCENTIDSDYCSYSLAIQNCFGCVGLNRKSFCIFNEQFTKEEYMQRLPELKKMPPQEVAERMEGLFTSVPRVAMYGKNNEGSYGEDIHNCKNTFWGFDSKDLHDCTYVYYCHDHSKDLVDCSHFGFSESCYEIMSGGYLNNCSFCTGCWFSSDIDYCELVYNSNHCFGCVGLNHKEYHILNQPYSKEEYFKEVARIKEQMKSDGEWGKWFASTYPEVLTYGL
ncbi:MAG: hypothetical protein AAB588_06515 [Patescibacteria group bacterium]